MRCLVQHAYNAVWQVLSHCNNLLQNFYSIFVRLSICNVQKFKVFKTMWIASSFTIVLSLEVMSYTICMIQFDELNSRLSPISKFWLQRYIQVALNLQICYYELKLSCINIIQSFPSEKFIRGWGKLSKVWLQVGNFEADNNRTEPKTSLN